jgi:hypothetical protein
LAIVIWIDEIGRSVVTSKAAALFFFGGTIMWSVILSMKGIFGYRNLLMAVPVVVFVFAVCSFYRFPAVMISLIALPLYFRFLKNRKGIVYVCALFFSTMILALSPIDVSLQNFPGGPRLVPAIHGLTDAKPYDGVVVGGCVVEYHYPKWVMVW